MGNYSSSYNAFLTNKQAFFSVEVEQSVAFSTTDTRHDAYKQTYPFIAENRLLIEGELNDILSALKRDKEKHKRFWLYAYYLAVMLHMYYKAYGIPHKAKEYQQLRKKIHRHIKEGAEDKPEAKDVFLIATVKKLYADTKALVQSPAKLSQLRDRIGFYNVVRIYWAFMRLTTERSLLLLRDWQVLDKWAQITGKALDVEKFIRVLEKPTEIFRFLSVALFLARLTLNISMLVKHTCWPSKGEDQQLMIQRFKQELIKRHAVMLNDVVWAAINLLTNYRTLFGISGPVAGWITAGFLVFDVAVIYWRLHLAEQDYLVKCAQYKEEEQTLVRQLQNGNLDAEAQRMLAQHLQLLNLQKMELDVQWRAKKANFYFNMLGAGLLCVGFTGSMVCIHPALIILAFGLCMIGVALYLSDGAYQAFEEKKERLAQLQLMNKVTEKDQSAYTLARNDFILTIVKNTVMPTLVILTFALSWEAALVLAVVYAGFEVWHAYQKHQSDHDECTLPPVEGERGVLVPSMG